MLVAVLAISEAGLAGQAPHETVGMASIIDGDTIKVLGHKIRLDGIDAPETAQICVRGSVSEKCGRVVALMLNYLIGRRTVRCGTHDVDQYGRHIATCWRGKVNLNEVIILSGQALAYTQYSGVYIGAEKVARQARRGVWATHLEMPWDCRRQRKCSAPKGHCPKVGTD